MAPLKRALAATRPLFLSASVLPVLTGTAWGWHIAGGLDAAAGLLALLATMLVHAASNVYNDISDETHGTDRANTTPLTPFAGGSRCIQEGLVTLGDMRRLAAALALLAAVAGALLVQRKGWPVLAFGLAGGALGAAYSLPGLRLCGRGLGELTIAIAFGVLPVTGAAWLQGADPGGAALLLALPVSAWIAAVITANEIPDAAADAATGKRTLAVRLGARTPLLYAALQATAFCACALLALRGLIPPWSLAVPAALLLPAGVAAGALRGGRSEVMRGLRLTLLVHAAGCLWLGAVVLGWGGASG